MTFRERIADWISGGRLKWERQRNAKLLHRLSIADDVMDEYEAAIRAIAAMETPSANATVKRMAKTAREALE